MSWFLEWLGLTVGLTVLALVGLNSYANIIAKKVAEKLAVEKAEKQD